MIKLKLSFGKDRSEECFGIVDGELLSEAVDRALSSVPLGKFEPHEAFVVIVNGLEIEKDFWSYTKLSTRDTVTLSPRISGGDAGQLFKQALIITVAVVASVYLTPLVGSQVFGALATAAVTIGATLLLNALIPPPVPELGGGVGGVEDSQMYAISGQSNQMKRLGIVPKVYGVHRVFPSLASVPYTEIAVDPATGETIQYLYAIYDFGLGTMAISEIKIGDTPLTTDSFKDFEYRLVDPAKPAVDEDAYDEALSSEFTFYKNRRILTPLSIALTDGSESIQFADPNSEGHPQEVVLDFVCPSGLYGLSSNGAFGTRKIVLKIEFALVGTEDWKSYNDMSVVSAFSSIGGSDANTFTVGVAPDGNGVSDYYYAALTGNSNSYNGSRNITRHMYFLSNQNKLLVPDDSRYQVGGSVFRGNVFLGYVQSINNIGGGNTEIILDRNVKKGYAYAWNGKTTISSGTVFEQDPTNVAQITFSYHGSGELVISSNKTSAVYAHLRFTPITSGAYKIRVKRVSTTGTYVTQKADDLTWTALASAYKIIPVNTTKRHLFLELKIKATDQLNGHIQNLSAQVSSVLPIYDPDTQTWTRDQTNNPAWVFCDLLTGEVNKRPIASSRLHMDSIVEWAEYCEEVPTPPPGGTYLEPRFQCNFILDYQATLQGVLAQVGSMAQASLNIIDGKYGVLIDKLKTVPVQIFTPRNSRDFSSTRAYGPRPHGVRVKYVDPQLDWDVSEIVVYDDGYDKTTATEFDDLTAFATTNYEQAWRFGRYMIAQNKLRQETISMLVDFENLICTRGDYVQITQDVMKVGGTPARVTAVDGNEITVDDSLDINEELSYGYVYRVTSTGEIRTSTLTALTPKKFQVDGDIPAVGDLIVIGVVGSIVFDCIVKSISPNDDMSAILTLIEKADGIFDYESSNELPEYDPQLADTSRPDFYPPKAVTNLTIGDNFWECSVTKSGYNYYVELTWDIPAGSVYEHFELWVSDGRGYRAYDTTTSKFYRYDVDQTRLDIEHKFKVVAVSASGKKLELISMPEVTTTPAKKVTPPSDIEALNLGITNQIIQLSWPAIADCDVAQYEIRFSPENNDVWESSIPLAKVSKNVTSLSVQARTGVYLIKAIDFNNNQSAKAARAVTTIPNLFDLNIIETMNEAPGFAGSLDLIETLGEAVILQEAVPGDVDTVQYYSEGYYEYQELLDLDDIFSVRLQSQIRADGLKKGELMSAWEHLEDVEHLNTALSSDWDVSLQYRATNVFASMADWEKLSLIDHLNFGAGVGFTEWRDVTTTGDATGRIFQFRVKMVSNTANVTPRLFDATVKTDMPDRIDSFENLVSHPSEAYVVNYSPVFKGPGTTPNVQISIDDAETGDYWTFDYKALEGFAIRFYDKNGVQVSRQFDVVAKGYGRRHTSSL